MWRLGLPLDSRQDSTNVLGLGSWADGVDQDRDRLSINGAATRFLSDWHGNHQFKFGLEYQDAGEEFVEFYVDDVTTYTVSGVPSHSDGNTLMSNVETTRATSRAKPANWNRSPRPSRWACASRSPLSGPSPKTMNRACGRW